MLAEGMIPAAAEFVDERLVVTIGVPVAVMPPLRPDSATAPPPMMINRERIRPTTTGSRRRLVGSWRCVRSPTCVRRFPLRLAGTALATSNLAVEGEVLTRNAVLKSATNSPADG